MKPIEKKLKRIKESISQNEILEALEILLTICKEKEYREHEKTILLLCARFANSQKEKISGVASNANFGESGSYPLLVERSLMTKDGGVFSMDGIPSTTTYLEFGLLPGFG